MQTCAVARGTAGATRALFAGRGTEATSSATTATRASPPTQRRPQGNRKAAAEAAAAARAARGAAKAAGAEAEVAEAEVAEADISSSDLGAEATDFEQGPGQPRRRPAEGWPELVLSPVGPTSIAWFVSPQPATEMSSYTFFLERWWRFNRFFRASIHLAIPHPGGVGPTSMELTSTDMGGRCPRSPYIRLYGIKSVSDVLCASVTITY